MTQTMKSIAKTLNAYYRAIAWTGAILFSLICWYGIITFINSVIH